MQSVSAHCGYMGMWHATQKPILLLIQLSLKSMEKARGTLTKLTAAASWYLLLGAT